MNFSEIFDTNVIMKVVKNSFKKLLDKTKEYSNRYEINKVYATNYKNHHSIEYKNKTETISTEPGSADKLAALSEEFIFSTQLWPNQPVMGLITRIDDSKMALVRPTFPKRKNNHHLLINIFDRPNKLVKGEEYTEFQFNQKIQSTEYYIHLDLESEYIRNEVLRNKTAWNAADNPDKLITVASEGTVVNFKYKDRYVRDTAGSNYLMGSKLMHSEILPLFNLWSDLRGYAEDYSSSYFQDENDIERLLLSNADDDIENTLLNDDHDDDYIASFCYQKPIEALFVPDNEGHCIILIPTKKYRENTSNYYLICQPFDGINPNHFANDDFKTIGYRFEYCKERNYNALNFLQKAIQGDLTNPNRTFDCWFREERVNFDEIQNRLTR